MTSLLQRLFCRKPQFTKSSSTPRHRASVRIEELESRTLMSITSAIAIVPTIPILQAPPAPQVLDGNFAAPALSKGSYEYFPTGEPWAFSNMSGVTTNGSGFTSGNPTAPTTRVAFLQGTGCISQWFSSVQGTYTLSFQIAQRANVQPQGYQAVDVFVDGTLVGVALPASTQYTLYNTQSFTLSAGTHILNIQGVDPLGANLPLNQKDTAFLTDVQFNSTIFSVSQSGPAVLSQAMSLFASQGSINYSGMLSIFSNVEASTAITTAQMQNLQTLVADAFSFNMPGYVSNLASKVVDGDAANATFQTLDYYGNVVVTPMGNLQVGCPGSHVTELVDKWFLGENEPTLLMNGTTASYWAPYYSTVLFGPGGPSYADVFQGGLGDCTVMATIAEVAARDNSAIQNMFTYDGTNVVAGQTVGVWTVRFFENGAPTYVTVDGELPNGGTLYANVSPSGVSWVPLAEKAYAELNQSGWLGTLSPGQNSYAALNDGDQGTAAAAMAALTGLTPSGYGINTSNPGPAMQAGKLVVMCTGNSVQSPTLFVHNHCYALIGYNATSGVFTVFNPWGVNSQQEFNMPGIVYCTVTVLGANFSDSVQAGQTPAANTMPTSAALQTAAVPDVRRLESVFATGDIWAQAGRHSDQRETDAITSALGNLRWDEVFAKNLFSPWL